MGWGIDAGTRQLVAEWASAVWRTPQTFRHIAFRKRTLVEELQEALLRGSLRKAFGGFDLLMLGLGIVIGSGWGQLSGYAAYQYAGPAIILSYLFSGVSTLLAATCFAELCAEFPVSGGAFSYVMATFGELPAFITLGGLLLEYAVGMAAVARGFSNYLARLCNVDKDLFVVEVGDPTTHEFDFMAAAIVMIMSVLLSLGVRESAFAISAVTAFKIVLLIFISIVGYTRGTWDNAEPFIDPTFGVDGIFLGAAVVFFTYVGFDAICNTAEEARNVAHLPWALVGTPLVAMVLYLSLAICLVVITIPSPLATDPSTPGQPYPGVSYPNLNECDAYQYLSFTTAFVEIQNMKWMQYVIAVAALLGIVTALTVGLFSISRIVMAASRDWLLPPFLARVSPRTQTPLVAQMVFGVIIAVLALLVEVNYATSLVSFGTLIAMVMVCNAQMWRRYYPDVQMRFTRYGTVEASTTKVVRNWVPALGSRLSLRGRRYLAMLNMLLINAASIAFAAYYAATTDVRNEPTSVGASPVDTATTAVVTTSCNASEPWVIPPNELQVDFGHRSLMPLWWALPWILSTALMQATSPLAYEPDGWCIPHWLMPWLPSAAICLVIFNVGALPNSEYWKIGLFFLCMLVFYLLYSLPMSYIKHNRVDAANDGLKVIELAFVDGHWQTARLNVVNPLHPASSVSPSMPSATVSSPFQHRSLELRGSLGGDAYGLDAGGLGRQLSGARSIGRTRMLPGLPRVEEAAHASPTAAADGAGRPPSAPSKGDGTEKDSGSDKA